jgi:hypothetical protein
MNREIELNAIFLAIKVTLLPVFSRNRRSAINVGVPRNGTRPVVQDGQGYRSERTATAEYAPKLP